MTPNHTPGPWHEGRYGVNANTTGYGRTHAQVALCENPANARFIVRAVNSHDALVAALDELLALATEKRLGGTHAAQSARAALAKAQS